MDEQILLKSNGKLSFSSFFSWVFDLTWGRKKGWKVVLSILIILVLGLAIGFLISGISRLLLRAGSRPLFYIWTLVYYFFDIILTSVFMIGMMNVLFDIVRKGDASIDSLFTNIGWNKIWKIVGCSLIFGLVGFVIGLLFSLFIPSSGGPFIIILILCIPLVVLGIRFMFPYYAIVDKGLGSVQALKYSWNITKGRFWEIVLLGLCFAGFIVIFGLLCLLFSNVILLLILLVVAFYIIFIPVTAIAFLKYYVIISENYEKKIGGFSAPKVPDFGNANDINVGNIINMGGDTISMGVSTNNGNIPNNRDQLDTQVQ